MDGNAHLFILCPQNTVFRGKTGHRMDGGADPFILWHKNESAERNGEGTDTLLEWIGCEWAVAEQKKISPVCQRELLRGLALPSEDIFLDGSSSGRGGDEFISGQNSELSLTARYFRPE